MRVLRSLSPAETLSEWQSQQTSLCSKYVENACQREQTADDSPAVTQQVRGESSWLANLFCPELNLWVELFHCNF